MFQSSGYIGREGYNGQDVVVWRKGGGYAGMIVAELGQGYYRVRYRSGHIVVVSGAICTPAGGALPAGNGR